MSIPWIENLISWIVETYVGILRAVLAGFRDPVSFAAVLTDLVHVAVLALVLLAGLAGIFYLAHAVLWALRRVWELAVDARRSAFATWRKISGEEAREKRERREREEKLDREFERDWKDFLDDPCGYAKRRQDAEQSGTGTNFRN